MVLHRFEKAGYETSAHATTGGGDATKAAEYAVERRFDIVVIVGGDGTINEAIQGIAGASERPNVGIIPAGTTNDFARALMIPRDTEKAVDIILDNHQKSLDVRKVNHKYFINIAGGGDLTELTYDVPSKLKTVLGQLAYYIKGIEMLPSLKPQRTKIEYDGEVFEDEIMLFLVANTNSVGGFEKLATLALRGDQLKEENGIYTKAKRIIVTPQNKMQLNIDGEYGGLLPGEFSNLKQHVNFFVPKQFLEDEEDS